MNAVDYLILGTDIGGLAFADVILSESDATIAFIQGHESDKIAARLASRGRTCDTIGLNTYTLSDWCKNFPSRADTCTTSTSLQAYCDHVLENRFLPESRVQLLQSVEHLGHGKLRSLIDGQVRELEVRGKIVNAGALSAPTCPSFIPSYTVTLGVDLVRPEALNAAVVPRVTGLNTICVLGGGRSGTDAVLRLLSLGVATQRIHWVKSRDPWMLSSPSKQASADESINPFLVQHEGLKAMAHAHSAHDLSLRLERLGVLVRTSKNHPPTYFSAHFLTPEDAQRIQQIPNTIRKGHLHSISEIGMILSRGVVPMPPQTLYIDCTGSRTQWHHPTPVFNSDRIELAEVRLCHPSFSATMIAAVELSDMSIEEKNAHCAPVTGSSLPDLMLTSLLNHHAWFYHDDLRDWLESCRLDQLLSVSAKRLNSCSKIPADLSLIRSILPRAIVNLESLIEQESAVDPLRA